MLIVTAAFLVVDAIATSAGASSRHSTNRDIDAVIVALLLFAAWRVYRGRHTAEPPKWMGRLQSATPSFSAKLGFLLLGVFPTDILTSATVGAHVARADKTWTSCLPFVALTLLLLAVPAILLLLFGKRAQLFLPKVRAWMNANSWVISEIVIAFFVVLTLT
jgi:hypothetical protein